MTLTAHAPAKAKEVQANTQSEAFAPHLLLRRHTMTIQQYSLFLIEFYFNMQFKAGYILDTVAKVITDFKATLDKRQPTDQNQLDEINGLLQSVSSFDVEFPYKHNPDFKKLNPVLATLNNIVTRGLPTRAPVVLE